MTAGQSQIIGSTGQRQHIMEINNSGAVPVAGYYNDVVYPLLVDSSGKLETSATVSVGSISTGSESYIYGKSGTGWLPALVDSTGALETTATVTVDRVFVASGADIGSVYIKDGAYVNVIPSGTLPVSGTFSVDSVFIASGADIGSVYLKDGGYVSVIPSGTFYSSVDTSGTTGLPVSGAMGRDWTLDNTTDSVSISGLSVSVDSVFIASGADIGSVHINNLTDLGSSVTQGTSPWVISGNVTMSDDNYIYVASSGTTGLPISGALGRDWTLSNVTDSVSISGLSVSVDSVFIASGATIGSVYLKDGATVTVSDLNTAGSLAVQTVDGTVSANINSASTIGSYTTQNVGITSSITMPISGAVGRGWNLSNNTDSVSISGLSVSVDSIFIASGANIGSVYLKDGATVTVNSLATAGSLAIQAVTGNIAITTSPVPVSGIVNTSLYAGSKVWQGTTPWVVAGSVDVNPTIGSPCFKQATAIASGAYTQVWGQIGAGSRIELHGYHISTNLPGIVTIVGSGTTVSNIAKYYLNYGSGACIEKTFCSPITPVGADIPLGFQTTVAGSTSVTIYGREVK